MLEELVSRRPTAIELCGRSLEPPPNTDDTRPFEFPRHAASNTLDTPRKTYVSPVSSQEQLLDSLRLRFAVYRSLGYLGSDITFDLDPFDWSSFHLVAKNESDDLVGTVRVIRSSTRSSPLTPKTQNELLQIGEWCDAIRHDLELSITPSASLPIFDTLSDNALAMSRLNADAPSELSRIIVAPNRRGQGVARMLCEAAYQKAQEIGSDVLYLQCLPDHAEFFNRLGYAHVLQALNYNHLIVPDRVLVMQRVVVKRIQVKHVEA